MNGFFKLAEHGTSVRTEIVAGITTFLTMAYIVFVNPSILQATGMDQGAVFVATCLAAALGSFIMGFYANHPIALAPGMGLNAYFTYSVVLGMNHPWQVALGAVFLSGVLFLILSILPIREWLINSIPRSLKLAIAAGIGLFLALIGLKNAGIVVDHPTTLVTLGDLTSLPCVLAAGGFTLMVALEARRVPGAIILAILAVTGISAALGLTTATALVSMPPSLAPTLLQLDILGALDVGLIAIIFAFLFVDLFDTAGTLVGISQRAGLLDARGRLPRLRRALIADSAATIGGAMAGTSTTTSYIESAAGTNAGGRTGLTSVTVGALFLLCLFFSPLAAAVPPYATAPALVFVATLMMKSVGDMPWDDLTEVVPAVVTIIAMPLTFSIATGIGFGFITYAAIKVLSGRIRDVSPSVAIIALLFVAKFSIL